MKQDYKYMVEIYPDSDTFNVPEVLSRLPGVFTEWAWILHDKDRYIDTTEDHKEGDLKKPHIHIVGKRTTATGATSPCPLSTIADGLGIPENYIKFCKSFNRAVRYLIHADEPDIPDKFKYPLSAVTASDNFDVRSYFTDLRSIQNSLIILRAIDRGEINSVRQMAAFALDKGVWSDFRSNFALWNVILREKMIGVEWDKSISHRF